MNIGDIAQKAGVSRATVSRYLNNGYVSDEKRARIACVIEQTGYVPSHHAQSLRTGKTQLVGVIIPKINSYSVSRMVAGIAEALNARGYQVLLANTDNDEARELEYLSIFAEKNRVDGLILIATVLTPAHKKALAALAIPVVVLGQRIEGISCVYHDDYHALYDISTQVLTQAKCPAYLGFNENDIAAGKRRREGFEAAARDAGIQLCEGALCEGDLSADSGYQLAEELLEKQPQLDAIICANDDMAFGAMTCLREYGRRVPEDVQVTGVGDGSLATIIYPSLTTVHFHYRSSGMEAARMLVQDLSGEAYISRQLMMGYELMRRQSTR